MVDCDGFWIAATASFIVREDVPRGDLVRVLDGDTIRPCGLDVQHPQKRQLSPKVRAFVDFASVLYC